MKNNIKHFFKRHRIVTIIAQVSLLMLVIFLVRSCQLAGTAKGVAPIIQDVLLSGEEINLKKYRGQPVLVHFWATWCPICKLSNSNVDNIAKDYAVITIAYWPESTNEIKDFMQTEKLSMPVIVDSMGEWAKQYGIRGVPVSFVLDPEGLIMFSEFGYTTEIGLRLRLWWAGQ